MAEPNEAIILDMLGDALRDAVIDARTRLSDTSIMARIFEGLVSVERGVPVDILESGMAYEDARAYLATLT